QDLPMTDIRRTLLWVVFGMSMLLLWDAWQKHNGHPSLFAPQAARPVSAAGSAPVVPVPAALPAGTRASVAGTASAAPVPSEQVTVTTDLFKATFDTEGGSLVHLELLKQVDAEDRSKNVVLFDRRHGFEYVAQSGLFGTAGVPTHLSVM